jgi:hypothetical protein
MNKPGLQERVELVTTILKSPPQIHPASATNVWSTEASCYEFLARNVEPGSKTMETGAGVSTVLFAAWGCEHLTVVPKERERDGILSYCADSGIDTSLLRFDVRGSEFVLPELSPDVEFDLVFIDGNHGFPIPIIDWFYGAGHLRDGGVVVFDDMQLPAVNFWIDWFLEKDARWERLDSTWKWRAYRRHSSGPLGELGVRQTFLPRETKPGGLQDVMQRGRAKLSRLVSSTKAGS